MKNRFFLSSSCIFSKLSYNDWSGVSLVISLRDEIEHEQMRVNEMREESSNKTRDTNQRSTNIPFNFVIKDTPNCNRSEAISVSSYARRCWKLSLFWIGCVCSKWGTQSLAQISSKSTQVESETGKEDECKDSKHHLRAQNFEVITSITKIIFKMYTGSHVMTYNMKRFLFFSRSHFN